MRRKANDDKMRQLIASRIQAAIKYQEQRWVNTRVDDKVAMEDTPKLNLALLKGTYWEDLRRWQPDGSPVVRRYANEVCPAVMTKMDQITLGEVSFLITARRKSLTEMEDTAAETLNDFWRVNRMSRLTDACLLDAQPFGYGVVKVGWNYDGGFELDDTENIPEADEGAEPILNEGGNLVGPEGMGLGEPTDGAEQAGEAEAKAAANRKQPSVIDDCVVKRIDPRDLLTDPNARSWDGSDARYRFERMWIPKYRLTADKTLKQSEVDKLEGSRFTSKTPPKDSSQQDDFGSSDPPEYRLCEIYNGYMFLDIDGDKRDEFVNVVMSGDTWQLLKLEECVFSDPDTGRPFLPFGNPFPFRVLPGRVLDNNDPIPDAPISHAAPLQLDYDESWANFAEHRRKSGRMVFVSKAVIEAAGEDSDKMMDGIDSGEDMRVVGVPPAMLLPGGFVIPVLPPVDSETVSSLERLPEEIRRQVGVGITDENSAAGKDQTATEINYIEQQANTRMGSEAQRYRHFIEDIATCILCMIEAFGTEYRDLKVTNQKGEADWRTVSYRELRGRKDEQSADLNPIGANYWVEVNAERKRPLDSDQRLDKLLKLTQFLSSMQGNPATPDVDMRLILNRVMKAFDIPEIQSDTPEGEGGAQQANPQQDQMMAQASQMIQQLQTELEQAKQAQPRPFSGSFKITDLPIAGQIQMAAKDGIILTPKDFGEQATQKVVSAHAEATGKALAAHQVNQLAAAVPQAEPTEPITGKPNPVPFVPAGAPVEPNNGGMNENA